MLVTDVLSVFVSVCWFYRNVGPRSPKTRCLKVHVKIQCIITTMQECIAVKITSNCHFCKLYVCAKVQCKMKAMQRCIAVKALH